MEAVVNDYISCELVGDPDLLPPGSAMPLMETGIRHSLGMLRRVLGRAGARG